MCLNKCFGILSLCHRVRATRPSHRNNHKSHHLFGYWVLIYHDRVQSNAYQKRMHSINSHQFLHVPNQCMRVYLFWNVQ